jgi:hypothetical protein
MIDGSGNPDPYFCLMDPDPGGSKTYGSGSATLILGMGRGNPRTSATTARKQDVLLLFSFYASHTRAYWR